MKQHAEDACGTIGIFHAILNNLENGIFLEPDGYLTQFVIDTQNMDPKDIADYFKKDEKLKQKHQEAVHKSDGVSQDKGNGHFIAFVHKNGKLYKLDGCQEKPIYMRDTTQINLLKDTCEIIKTQYMDLEPDNIHFSTLVLATNPDSFN